MLISVLVGKQTCQAQTASLDSLFGAADSSVNSDVKALPMLCDCSGLYYSGISLKVLGLF